jgi:hypothetical protein
MKIFYIIIIIFIFIVLFHNISSFTSNIYEKSYIMKNLYNGNKWNKYRLGDVVFRDPYGEYYTNNFYDSVLYHEDLYPGTIASEYMKLNKNLKNLSDFKLLNDIIAKKQKNENYISENTLILHIRVGDVMCKYRPYEKKIYSNKYTKVGDTRWWNGVLEYISKNGIKNVVIIAGTHFNDCIKESSDYLLDRKNFLKESLPYLTVSFRLGQSPDEDILFCKNTKHFITTGGGYGELLQKIIKNN